LRRCFKFCKFNKIVKPARESGLFYCNGDSVIDGGDMSIIENDGALAAGARAQLLKLSIGY